MYVQINKTRVVLLLVQRLPKLFPKIYKPNIHMLLLASYKQNQIQTSAPTSEYYYYEHLVSCSGGLLRARQMACSSLRPSSSTSSSRSQRFKWKTQRVVIRFELPRHLKLQIQGRLYQEKECTKTSPKGIYPSQLSFFTFSVFWFWFFACCWRVGSSINQEAYHRRVK